MFFIGKDDDMSIQILDYQVNSFQELIKKHYKLDENTYQMLKVNDLSDPFQCTNMELCISLLRKIKENHEKILICGDYDCDGICATAILCKAFDQVGIEYGFYIPHRINEGYGLSLDTVEKAYQKGYQNIITVDNGVSSIEAMHYAKKHEMCFILTDHHKFNIENIECDCLIHPFLKEDVFKNCSGAGMALQVARCLIPNDKEIVALAAIALIADCMDVTLENRNIIRNGIDYLNQGCCPSLHALKNKPEDLFDMRMISYTIVPKINSMGRLADKVNANNAVRYLLLKDPIAIMNTASQINQVNELRKNMTSEMEKIANGEIKNVPFEVITSCDFHEGIVGLVASRMASSLHRPVLILSELENEYKGSMRSVEGFDIVQYFNEFDGFDAFGGHAQAAGVTIKKENLTSLLEYLQTHELHFENIEEMRECVKVDENICTIQDVFDYMELAPFGQGFEEITFYIENIQIQTKISLSNGKYYKVVSSRGIEYLFFKSNLIDRIHDSMNVIGKLKVNQFRGQYSVNMIVEDIIEKIN